MNVILLVANWQRGHETIIQTTRRVTRDAIRSTEMRFVWLATAPLALLILSGAGLNPFVCLPAVFGILMWLIHPLVTNQQLVKNRQALIVATVLSVACFGLAAKDGWKRHRPGEFNSMEAHKLAVENLTRDAVQTGVSRVNFDTLHVYYLNSSSLLSTIRFDMPGTRFENRNVFINDVQVSQQTTFSGVVAQANWDALAGNETEKLDGLFQAAERELDYVIIPDLKTIEFIEDKISHNIINRHQRYLRERFLSSDTWVAVSPVIVNGKNERVQIFRNRGPARLAIHIESPATNSY